MLGLGEPHSFAETAQFLMGGGMATWCSVGELNKRYAETRRTDDGEVPCEIAGVVEVEVREMQMKL
jgi:hypothetical protein